MKRKYLILTCLFFMVVGYASVSTTLSLKGNSDIANKLDEFDVYFSDVLVNGERDMVPVKDPHTLEFHPDFTDGEYELEYDVTNSSPDYDADVDVVCTSENKEFVLSNSFDNSKVLESSETRKGTLTISVSDSPWIFSDNDLDGQISVGDLYTLRSNSNEKFNVIGVTDEKISLLSSMMLDSTYRQSSSPQLGLFASEVGWEYKPGPKEIDIFAYEGDAGTFVTEYVSFLRETTGDTSITGNLITLKELKSLGCIINDDYSSTNSDTLTCENSPYASWLLINNAFWTRSANPASEKGVWAVVSSGKLGQGIVGFIFSPAGYRPVITIDKSVVNAPVTCKIVAKAVENKELGGGTVPGPVVPLTEAEKFCCDKGFKYGMDFIMPYQSSDFDEYLATPAYTCSNNEDYDPYYNFDKDGNLIYTNDIDPQTFCENKGYSYGMYGANTYTSAGWEEGNYDETVYLCAYDVDFEFDVDGYDRDGNLVWQFISDRAM